MWHFPWLSNLISRLTGKNQKQIDLANSPFVVIKDANGRVSGMMDTTMARYLSSTAPEPSQASLDAMLDKTDNIRVLNGGVIEKKALGSTVLLTCNDTPSLDSLRQCLAIVDEPGRCGHCMCHGDTAIEFYEGDSLLATIGLHHGRSIRWDDWNNDALLLDGQTLLSWLKERGVDEPYRAYQEAKERTRKAERALELWKEAMPACLMPYWSEIQDSSVPNDILQEALTSAYADKASAILALFEWFGSGEGPWSGYPIYEGVPEQLLLDYPTEVLVAALDSDLLTPRQWEGAARYFGGWDFNKQKKKDRQLIPETLKQQLLRHTLESHHLDNIERARRAFT